tara:strand:- start:1498 stop:1872 length:375 start_codon:yes stop_codon:yes gene_type:complete
MRKGTTFRKNKDVRKSQREKVFDYIKKGEASTQEIQFGTRIKIHSLTGRLAELEQDGLIYQRGKFIPEKGQPFTIWSATPYELIPLRKAENWNKRLILWLEKGKRNGFVTQKELNELKRQTVIF